MKTLLAVLATITAVAAITPASAGYKSGTRLEQSQQNGY